MTVKPKYFPIRSDYTQVVQLIITNPYKTFLERMGLLLAGTFIIVLLVIVCISYQVRFISRFEKIFQIYRVHLQKENKNQTSENKHTVL